MARSATTLRRLLDANVRPGVQFRRALLVELRAVISEHRVNLVRHGSYEVGRATLDIAHRLNKPKHPWTNGQVERMNRTLKEATTQRIHYDDHAALRQHLTDFFTAKNYARRLKTLKRLTPYEFICQTWTKQPERFLLNRSNKCRD